MIARKRLLIMMSCIALLITACNPGGNTGQQNQALDNRNTGNLGHQNPHTYSYDEAVPFGTGTWLEEGNAMIPGFDSPLQRDDYQTYHILQDERNQAQNQRQQNIGQRNTQQHNQGRNAQNQHNRNMTGQPNQHGRTDNQQGQANRGGGAGILNNIPGPDNPQTNANAQEIADRLVKLATRVEQVNDATAVVVGRYAVVGIDVDAKLDRGKVGTIKYSVAEALKADPHGAYAIVTADIDTNFRLREMAEDIRAGRPIAGIMDELAEIVGRIMPQIPRHVPDAERTPERPEPDSQTIDQ